MIGPLRRAEDVEPFVRVADVSLTYGGGGVSGDAATPALADISLDIHAGEFIAIVGPSGCGKSTLLKLVSGLAQPSRGTVSVSGQDVAGPLKIVGMAFQNATLLPWRSVRENVLLPIEIVEPHRGRYRQERAQYRKAADDLLARVGLDGFGDRSPWQLSGGMQQRAQLCRALIHEPALLLLDEPFGALDAFTREELWTVLEALYIDRRCTIILVTHDLREAVFLADTVYIMSARPGRIVASRSATAFPRPRTLETTFVPEFVDLVHDLRHQISLARAVG